MKFEIIPNEQTPRTTPIMDVRVFIDQYKDELTTFLAFAKKHNRAAGLAANQMSLDGERLNFRAFAIGIGEYKNTSYNKWHLAINPQIISFVGFKQLKEEGCLTWGRDKKIIASRYHAVWVSYWDLAGNFHNNEFLKGWPAQVWQHEMDHLNGVEFDVRAKEEFVGIPAEPLRNDACPCKSGKKYKKCCLTLTE